MTSQLHLAKRNILLQQVSHPDSQPICNIQNNSNSCSLTSTRVIVFILEPVVCLLGFPGFPVGMTAYKKP
jgi:hypothetical protein